MKTWPSLFILLVVASAAQAVMQLAPPIQEIEATRGGTAEFTVTVFNTRDEEVPSSFSVHDMDITEDGRPFIANGGLTRGCGAWIELEPKQCLIKPHESVKVRGRVNVPRSAEGGYYAMVRGTFSKQTVPITGEAANIQGSSLGIAEQAAVVLMVSVPSSRTRPVLVPDSLVIFAQADRPTTTEFPALSFRSEQSWRLILSVKNEGNIHTQAEGQVSFWTETGRRFDMAPLRAGRGYVLPGKRRNFVAEGNRILADGNYLARMVIQMSDRASISKSLPVSVYKGEALRGEVTEKMAELIRASSPGFSLREPFTQAKITPGGNTYLGIQLMSIVTDTLTVIPRKLEWNLNDWGQPVFSDDASLQPRSCNEWIDFADEEIQLLPGRNSLLKIRVNSPEDLSGEYYSAITFDPDRPRPDLPPEFLAGRTQLIALSAPRGEDCVVELDSIKINKETSPELTLHRFLVTVRNAGNVHCFVSGKLSLEREATKDIYKPVGGAQDFGDTQTYLLPGGERTFEIDIPNMEKGQYRTILAVNYKAETQPVVKYQRIKIR